MRKQPRRFMTKVAKGNTDKILDDTNLESRYQATDPMAPPTATYNKLRNIFMWQRYKEL